MFNEGCNDVEREQDHRSVVESFTMVSLNADREDDARERMVAARREQQRQSLMRNQRRIH